MGKSIAALHCCPCGELLIDDCFRTIRPLQRQPAIRLSTFRLKLEREKWATKTLQANPLRYIWERY
jgi:hypothetical protein